MSTNYTPVSPISPDFQNRIDAEYRKQLDDQRYSELAVVGYNRERRARFCNLVNATKGMFHTADQVVEFYHRRYYGVAPVAAPYTARQAERDILDAGVPYNYVRSMTKAGFTRESVEAGIKAYFALKSAQYERNAAKLALVLSR